ncbi:MAG: FixH family protein [Ignavibacterium sp.]|nr:FixH family protein [Ignavibacterium sp.]MDW8374541.1 FixH family protein [Ignavibacteriales bacterium]
MKKISWGTGILISIIIFMILTISTTIYLMNQKVDLVTEDYYLKGLDYQKQIDIEKRSTDFSDKILIDYDGQFVIISFPETLKSNLVNGEILFYRPSDSNLDITIPIKLENQKQIIPVSTLKKGFWRIKINWNYNNNNYYKESIITL